MGYNQDIMNIKINIINMVLDARKVKNEIMMFYLKVERYYPEGTKPQEENSNIQEEKKDGNYEK